ncbi:hypothetical protein SteCoe_36477 [Stentor coeruleus]|uniref:Uncharacterized protein n=1 Tax=Stentor coeruleus TaxID=5963 RepID=A0A1R2AQE1_9CILI|nr:hypothetical protein SteCoe_36477 [Stentor coeruleus]
MGCAALKKLPSKPKIEQKNYVIMKISFQDIHKFGLFRIAEDSRDLEESASIGKLSTEGNLLKKGHNM